MTAEEVLRELLSCMCVALGGAGWEGECCLAVGPPEWTHCCGDDGRNTGGAWGRLVSLARDELAPDPVDLAADPSWRLTVELGAVTCVCYDECDCEARDANASRVLAMTEAALAGLTCCYAGQACDPGLTVDSVVAVDSEGTCAGFVATVTVDYTLCCPAG